MSAVPPRLHNLDSDSESYHFSMPHIHCSYCVSGIQCKQIFNSRSVRNKLGHCRPFRQNDPICPFGLGFLPDAPQVAEFQGALAFPPTVEDAGVAVAAWLAEGLPASGSRDPASEGNPPFGQPDGS